MILLAFHINDAQRTWRNDSTSLNPRRVCKISNRNNSRRRLLFYNQQTFLSVEYSNKSFVKTLCNFQNWYYQNGGVYSTGGSLCPFLFYCGKTVLWSSRQPKATLDRVTARQLWLNGLFRTTLVFRIVIVPDAATWACCGSWADVSSTFPRELFGRIF